MNKRILFFSSGSYVSGKEIVTLSIIKGLKVKGHEVRCVISGWNDGDFKNRLHELGIEYCEVKLGFVYITKPLWTLDTIIHFPGAVYKVLKYIKKFAPDILYHDSYRSIIQLRPFLRKENILHIHDYHLVNKKNRFFLNLIATQVRYVICVSNHIRNNILEFNIPSEKVITIYNGIDHETVIEPVKKQYSYPLNIAIVGQILPHKGHQVLLQALLNMKEKDKVILNIYGNGSADYIKNLKQFIVENKLETKVVWKGFVKNKNEIYTNTDLVIAPTLTPEPFALIALEPGLYYVPAIVSAIGGFLEIVIPNYNGILFEPGNNLQLAQILDDCIQNTDKIRMMGLNANKHVSENFSYKVMINKIEKTL